MPYLKEGHSESNASYISILVQIFTSAVCRLLLIAVENA